MSCDTNCTRGHYYSPEGHPDACDCAACYWWRIGRNNGRKSRQDEIERLNRMVDVSLKAYTNLTVERDLLRVALEKARWRLDFESERFSDGRDWTVLDEVIAALDATTNSEDAHKDLTAERDRLRVALEGAETIVGALGIHYAPDTREHNRIIEWMDSARTALDATKEEVTP